MAGVPAPPLGCCFQIAAPHGIAQFDFRYPGEAPAPDAPVSYRWRFARTGGLFGFYAFGWRVAKQGKTSKKPPRRFYGLLPDTDRDEYAKELMA